MWLFYQEKATFRGTENATYKLENRSEFQTPP
jgi:hypothetical protein